VKIDGNILVSENHISSTKRAIFRQKIGFEEMGG
jgi:hypothetical protein